MNEYLYLLTAKMGSFEFFCHHIHSQRAKFIWQKNLMCEPLSLLAILDDLLADEIHDGNSQLITRARLFKQNLRSIPKEFFIAKYFQYALRNHITSYCTNAFKIFSA